MTTAFRDYTTADYLRVRDFLSETYGKLGETHNWHITRWNFALHVGAVFHDQEDAFATTAGLWEDEHGIVAVVHSEGEDDGEAFFQIRQADLPTGLLVELFQHAETRLGKVTDGEHILNLILPDVPAFTALAEARGYVRVGEQTVLTIDCATTGDCTLLPGLRLVDGREYPPEALSLAHERAFGYGDSQYVAKSRRAFAKLRQAPDYRADLALAIVNEADEIAAFSVMWLDARNRTGCLEPVGTIPAYRRQGLGRAVIDAGLKRLANAGALTATVGSNQRFYHDIGFRHLCKQNIWRRSWLHALQ